MIIIQEKILYNIVQLYSFASMLIFSVNSLNKIIIFKINLNSYGKKIFYHVMLYYYLRIIIHPMSLLPFSCSSSLLFHPCPYLHFLH